MLVRRIRIFLCALAVLCLVPAVALADQAFVRVIAQRAPVHTGPGATYREIFVAERGQVLPVLERGTRGYWFRVELDDGTTGWIFGELVFPFEVVDDHRPGLLTRMGRGLRRTLLAPSPVPHASVGVSFSAGLLGGEGMFLLRPAWLVDEYFALEVFAGSSPRAQLDLFLAGLGWTLRLVPGAAIGPYVNGGVGAAYYRPKADNFTDEEETRMAVVMGGGFEITFKKQITVRLDVRNWTLFDTDKAHNAQEYTSGLAIFF